MTCRPTVLPAGCRDNAGFTVVESLVALVLMLVITGVVFGMVNPGTSMAYAQPEAMDMQQRARVASDLVSRDLYMAGAGVYSGPETGPLTAFFAPIIPRKMGRQGADAHTVVRPDAISISYIPHTYSQTTIGQALPQPSAELRVNGMPNCPQGQQLCGFKEGMTVLIFDAAGHFDFFTVTDVEDSAGHLRHHQSSPSHAYQAGAYISEADSHVYYHDAANRQLRHYDGDQTDVPVVDNVVSVRFEYFGDPSPPTKPKPEVGESNCLYDTAGNPIGGLATLSAQGGSLAALPLSLFSDGPWCGAGDNRFDADLLRVKQVRATIRVQAAQASMRATGADYAVSGTSRSANRALQDYTIVFETAPRNMNLGR